MRGKSKPRHIFLSYSRDDVSVMNRIRMELQSAGFSVWTDEGLVAGTESWKSEIERAICEALGMVVILSPSAKQSLWVERELDFAGVHGVRVFPVLVQGDPGSAIPIELISAQWMDMRKAADFSAEMHNLISALQERPGGRSVSVEHRKLGPLARVPAVLTLDTRSVLIIVIVVAVCMILAISTTVIFGPGIIENLSSHSTDTPGPEEIVTSKPQDSATEKAPTATSPLPIETPTETETSTSRPPTELTREIPTSTKTPTPFPTFTRAPQWGFQDDCIHSSLWAAYPEELSTSDARGCLLASDLGFDAQDQGLRIDVQDPESDQRYGLFSQVNADVLIEFDVRIDRLETGVDDELVSLGFGIISLNPINTETDGFIFYVIESPNEGYPVFVKKGERGGLQQYIEIDGSYLRYELGTIHRLSFWLQGDQLSIAIDGKLIRGAVLPHGERGFFIGYKFENVGILTAQVSNLSMRER